MLLARTDWSVPKHAGLTYFALPMSQPGVEVRPLRQMNGHASFNEVFLDSARVSVRDVIGSVGGGWAAALTTLAHERRLNLSMRGSRSADDGVDEAGRVAREAALETAAQYEPYRWYPQRAGRADLVVARASGSGSGVVRDGVAGLVALTRVAQWTASRAGASRASGRPPGAEGSLGKLAASAIARSSARWHSALAGPWGMLSGLDDGSDGVVAEVLVSVPAVSIAGGTDEIQRNILGERMLGLPREPSVDRDVPFRDVLRNR
jgi:alkylation response protein AidB-like acyl-CoA dehydrogenase